MPASSELADHERRHPALGHRDGRLDHRQRERLDAVAGDRQLGPLGGPQRGGDVDADRDVRADELDEAAPRRWWNESSLCHSVSSASRPMTSNRGHRHHGGVAPSRSVDRVEVVVDGDAADAHRVGDLLDGPAQRERAALVEQPHGPLLVLPAERRAGGRRARPRRRRSAGRARRAAAACGRRRRPGPPTPAGRRSASLLVGRHERGADGVDDRLDGGEQRVLAGSRRSRSVRPTAGRGAATTWVAPLANAARRDGGDDVGHRVVVGPAASSRTGRTRRRRRRPWRRRRPP